MSLAKDKYREETNEDCYCEQWQVEGGSYKDEYVIWLEQQLVNKLNLPDVSQQRELLLAFYEHIHREYDIKADTTFGEVYETFKANNCG